ncbi:hypothetical protein [Meridianimarinicoccus roseus]|uniref:hypothetical protein n=1 Tax=Meridianimarinicoccus roseus TaxID=2072018 RepID=UPI001EE64FDE|nr:hypothetical protein [Meridianimarinicoccus roseus]
MAPTRRLTAGLALALVATVLLLDLAAGSVPNPYRAPALLALGSGQVASGGHCAALPGN